MAAFPPVESSVDFVALEERVLERWREHDVFAESLRRREGCPDWVFYEGPPTANGRPGLHHVWARSFKDLFPRFHTMRGRYVARKGGWDCHGLPVEVEVEKELGLSGKTQIREFGIEEFNRRCRESVHRYVEEWAGLTERMGMWLDTDAAYWTLTDDYIETVWWLIRQMWDKGLLYEGFKVVPYCGRCGTALSSHEVAQGYRDITEDSVYVRFPVVGRDFDLLAWTTTPWTLISNVAAAVGPEIEYARVRRPGDDNRDVVLGRDRVEAVLGPAEEVGWEIVETLRAADLIGLHYERPFDLVPIDDDANRVVPADWVTTADGSGIVHLAPAFGEADREVGMAEGLPTLNPVDTAARFEAIVEPWAGLFVKEADPGIIEALRGAGRLEKVEPYEHSYPHCWRCGTALIYYAKTSWFARTQAEKQALIEQNETIAWHPEHIKHGRFGDWLENNIDWALSRDRYWGTPLPVWRCAGETPHDTCIGSVAELGERAGRDLTGLDLHRPYVDDVTFPCPVDGCGATATRLEPVLDAWFDSGSMPAAQFHHPFAAATSPGGKSVFEDRFPADFICEAIDQTRGWFYSLLAVNTLVFGRSPYRNVVCLAHVVDQDGAKMSKSKGNVLDPWEIFRTKGADPLRWYFFSAGSPWTNRRVYGEGIDESIRKFLLTTWNTLSFFVTYANLEGWEPGRSAPSGHVLDRWLASRREGTKKAVTEALEGYDTLAAAQLLEGFVDDLSNWYVRRSRPRFWKASDPGAFGALHEALSATALMLAPFCPFVADEIYGVLTAGRREVSVHLEDWPVADESLIDADLEAEMALARRLVALGRAARGEARIKVRQPLGRALLLVPAGSSPAGSSPAGSPSAGSPSAGGRLSAEVAAQVSEELNVKALEVVESLAGLIRYSVVPNFRALGPRLGPKLPAVKAALASADGAEVSRSLEESGSYTITIDGEPVVLGSDDLEVRAQEHEEFALAQDGPYAVALDLKVGNDLRLEGLARELARAINDHRKARGLAIADRIRVRLWAGDGPVAEAATRHGDWIAAEVLAVDWQVNAAESPSGETLDVDGVPVTIAVAVSEPA